MCGTPPLNCCSVCPIDQATATLSFPPELGCEAALLKTPRALATGHGEVKLVLTRKLPFSWLAFTVLEGVMQPARGGKVKSYPAVNAVH